MGAIVRAPSVRRKLKTALDRSIVRIEINHPRLGYIMKKATLLLTLVATLCLKNGSKTASAKDPRPNFNFVLTDDTTGCRPKEARTLKSRHIHDAVIIFPPDESKGETDSRVIFLTPEAIKIIEPLMGQPSPCFETDWGIRGRRIRQVPNDSN